MEENNKDTKKTEVAEEVDLAGGIGLVKKLFIFLLLLVAIAVIGLFSLQSIIKLESVKNDNNKEISEILVEEVNKINPEENKDNKLKTSLAIKGNMSFKSFLIPHILIVNIEGKDLIENNYIVDFNIEKIRLYLSPEHLIKKQFVVNKVEIINANFNIEELNKDIEIKIIGKIINKYFNRLVEKYPDVKILLKNNNIVVNAIKYKRELTDINISGIYSQNKLSFSGKLISNKQPLNINIDLDKNKDDFSGKINLNSQAFSVDTSLKANFKDLKFSGNSNLNLTNPQIFSRTIFNTSDFLYRRVIDNVSLKVNFEFNLENDVLDLKNIVFDGRNMKGSGTAQFNFIENQKNTVNFNIETINLDALIIKNMVSKNTNNISEKDISIFSGTYSKEQKSNYSGFIESKLKINPIFFDVKIKEIQFNQDKITDAELDFSYSDDYKYKFNNIAGKFPGETDLIIENKKDEQLLNIKGNDINGFWNFIKNSVGTYSKTTDHEKVKFEFNGIIKIDGDRLFINNGNFFTDNLKSENTIEVKFDSGISFIAIDTKINNLLLDNFITENKEKSYLNINTLKNKILFLNTFTLNTFLKFEIKNIQYKDFKDINYNFVIRTSQGLLNIYNINLNDKIKGGVIFDILQLRPKIDMKLKLENLHIDNNIDLNRILFDLPTLEDFYGNVNIIGNNILFKNSPINTLEFIATLQNGLINFSKFEIDGFGGKCKIGGFLNMQYNRKLNLTFNGCTGDLKDLLYIFTGSNNISGLVGFSSVLYAEGQNMENFIQSYIFKLNFTASGINVNKFGLENLSGDLLKVNTNEELLNSLNPEKVLYDENSSTLFERIPKGTIQYSKKSGGQFDFDIKRLMINGKVNGKFELFPKYIKLELNSNFTMLSGALDKLIPLNLAIAINGNTSEKLGIATNFQNINSYILSVKKQFEELKKQEEQKRLEEEQKKPEEENQQIIQSAE